LAKFVVTRNPKNALNQIDNNYILNIKCAEDHLVDFDNGYGQQVLKNGIHEMIKTELGLDSHYISTTRTILVRVDQKTIGIPLFRT